MERTEPAGAAAPEGATKQDGSRRRQRQHEHDAPRLRAGRTWRDLTGTLQLAVGRNALFCDILETEAEGAKENRYANGTGSAFEVRG